MYTRISQHQALMFHNEFIRIRPPLIHMQSPSGAQQENPIGITSNVVAGLATPVFQPTYPYVGRTPLSWSGPQVPATAPPIPDNASLIRELADEITSKKNDPLPEWRLAEFNGDPLKWHEWYGQFKSAIDLQSLTDDVKMTYLRTLVTGKLKIAIAEFSYCGLMYKGALRTLERKFGQPQARPEDNSTSVTKTKTASKVFASNSQQRETKEANAMFFHKHLLSVHCLQR